MHLRRAHTRLLSGVLGIFGIFGILGPSLAGCGPGDGEMMADADTGMPADADAGLEVLPPNIDWLDAGAPPIALPSFTPCPEGWREVGGDEEGEPVTCAPYPESGPEACADGWAHFSGEPGCTPVGAPCPSGDFPEGLPTDSSVLYVLAGATTGGDGSEGAPLATIGEAMDLASPSTVIALGKGTYDEAVYLAAGVTLWGACAAETRLTASSPSLAVRGVVQVFAADTELHNVRIGPAELPGLVVAGARADLTIDGVLIEDTRSAGLTAIDGGRVGGRTLSVSGTRADSAGVWGFGILARTEGTTELARVLLSHNRTLGVLVLGVGTSATLTDLVVRDTLSQRSNGRGGGGLNAQQGATADITRALFEGNREVGVMADGAGASVTLTDIVVRDTQGREAGRGGGLGLNLQAGATAEVTRGLFEGNRVAGILVSDVDTSAALTDVVVRGTQSEESDGALGRGLDVQEGATADVTRGLFEGNRDVGVYVSDVGTSVTLTNLIVRGTQSQESDQRAGRGLTVQGGATGEVTGALVEQNRDVGVFLSGVGTSLTLIDLVVRDTQSRESDGAFGRGMSIQGSATADVTRALLERNRGTGAFLSGAGTALTLTDLVVRDTRSRESDNRGGLGVTMQLGVTADITRALFARNHNFGIIAASEGTTARLTDIVVEDTTEQTCAATTCPERPYGVGLASTVSATMTATRFALTGSALCGVFLIDHGELDLSMGEVSGSPVGVCLQVDGYPVARLSDGVRYVSNDTNLDATTLPIPELTDPADPTP